MPKYTTDHSLPLPQPADKIAASGESMRLSLCAIAEASEREFSTVAARIAGLVAGSPAPQSLFQNVFYGPNALGSAGSLRVRNNEAFGTGALANATRARYNSAFGYDSLHYLDSGPAEPDETYKATRNSAFGSNSQRFNKVGFNNVSMGRNSMQCNVTGTDNVSLGAGSMAGLAPVGLGGIIENQFPQNVKQSTAVGTSTLDYVLGDNNSAFGFQAARNLKASLGTVAIGSGALANLDAIVGSNGKYRRNVSWSVSYAFVSSLITVVYPGHGLALGNIVHIVFPAYGDQHLEVSAISGDSFNLGNRGNSFPDAAGAAQVVSYTTNTNAKLNNYNTGVGFNSLGNLEGSETISGTSASNTAVGLSSMRNMQDGSPAKHVGGSTALGANSAVSGNNQVQLGANSDTVYAGQAIQIRSDARDKTDIRDTVFGLDFINRLRPVDYRWDRRSDYFERDEGGAIIAVHERDGSKRGLRYHHGLIAQEVQEVIASTGIDFGGFQDHSVHGGNDVLSIGYEELIAPLVKAIQELSSRVTALEGPII